MPAQSLAVSELSGQAFLQVIDTPKVLIGVLQRQLDARTQETRELRAQVVGLLEWRKPAAPADVSVAPVNVPAVTRRDMLVVSVRRRRRVRLGVVSRLSTVVHALASLGRGGSLV